MARSPGETKLLEEFIKTFVEGLLGAGVEEGTLEAGVDDEGALDEGALDDGALDEGALDEGAPDDGSLEVGAEEAGSSPAVSELTLSDCVLSDSAELGSSTLLKGLSRSPASAEVSVLPHAAKESASRAERRMAKSFFTARSPCNLFSVYVL